MAKNRFAGITTTRLDLSDGDWIEAKDELTYGEQLELQNASLVGLRNGVTEYDLGRYHLKRMEVYITDWNLAGPDGKTINITPFIFGLLNEETATEINEALDKHIAKLNEDEEETASNGAKDTAKNPKSGSGSNA